MSAIVTGSSSLRRAFVDSSHSKAYRIDADACPDNSPQCYVQLCSSGLWYLAITMGMSVQPYIHLFTYCLGYLVIAIGAYGQLPLLYKILRFRSGKSYISIANITTLFITTTNFVVYAVHKNLPINTWGECLLQMALYVIIVNLMLLYHGRHCYAVIFMLAYLPLMVVLLWPVVPGVLVSGLMMSNFFLLGWRKVNWLYKCYKEEGQTYFSTKTALTLMNVGSVSRLLTSLVDTGDSLFIYLYLQECIFNGVLTAQCLHYSRKRHRLNADRRSSRSSG